MATAVHRLGRLVTDMRNPLYVLPGDVIFCRGLGILGKLIRWAEKDPGEAPSWTNHVAVVTRAGWMFPPVPGVHEAEVAEALWHVENNPWYSRHRKDIGYSVRVYRRKGLDAECPPRVVDYVKKLVGANYGWWKLGAHLIDRLLFRGKKILSSLMFIDSRPICSYLVAHAYDKCGIQFGTEPEAADPDTMLDHVENSPFWEFVGEGAINELDLEGL